MASSITQARYATGMPNCQATTVDTLMAHDIAECIAIHTVLRLTGARSHPTYPIDPLDIASVSPHRVGMDVRAHIIGKPRAVQQLGVPFGMLAAI